MLDSYSKAGATAAQGAGAVIGSSSRQITRQADGRSAWNLPWRRTGALIWCGGCVVLLSRLAWQLIRLRRRMAKLPPPDANILSRLDAAWPPQSRIPLASVEIAIDDQSNTPYSFRLLKHRLVLPSQWIKQMPETLRPVLAHELAHLGHRDTWLVLLCRAMLALHWWNPLAWMVRRYVDRAIEWRADEAAAADPQAAVALARVLYDASLPPIMEVSGIDPAHAAFPRRAGETAERICRLLKPPAATMPEGSVQCRITALMLAAICIATIAGCAALVPPSASGELTAQDRAMIAALNKPDATTEKQMKEEARKQKRQSARDELFKVAFHVFEQDAEGTVPGSPIARIVSRSQAEKEKTLLLKNGRAKSIAKPWTIVRSGDVATSRVIVNHPVVAASEPGKVSVEYLPVGDIFDVLPMRLADGNLYLDLNMTMSDVVGERNIGGNTYPVISSCDFSAPITFKSGESVVISGLEIDRTLKRKKTAITVFVTVDTVRESEVNTDA